MNEKDINSTGPCAPSRMQLTNRRIIVMQGSHPVSVHDSLDNAMVDIGKRAADMLLDWFDPAQNALYLMAVDR